MRKNSMSPDFKIKLVKEYLAGRGGYKSIALKYGIGRGTLRKWIWQYESMGSEAFIRDSNKSYPVQLKESVVVEYLETSASQSDICKKYKILSTCTLRTWIKKYNSHEKFKSAIGGRVMTKGRKTTYEERIEIVAYCTVRSMMMTMPGQQNISMSHISRCIHGCGNIMHSGLTVWWTGADARSRKKKCPNWKDCVQRTGYSKPRTEERNSRISS